MDYLRLSPSYTLALRTETEEELAIALNDPERAGLVWRTRQDMGDVHATIFKFWWIERGLKAFGVHSQRPTVSPLLQLTPARTNEQIEKKAAEILTKYLGGSFERQGRPDSILVSIPLIQETSVTVRQLKKALSDIKNKVTLTIPETRYRLVQNKMRMDRLKAGIQLVLFRAEKPKDELWRIAARAKISREYGGLDPNGPKKNPDESDARRMLTIMASRLYHDTLVIAENAAIGKFPSLDPIKVMEFDLKEMGLMMRETFKREKAIKARIKAEAEREKGQDKESQ